jgi:trk system potassium uptake protein TrkA
MSERKHVCVVGLGQFGAGLALKLAERFDVLAMDTDEERVAAVSDRVQRALILDGRDYESLSAVVTSDFDCAIVGMGGSLESSILCTLHLKRIGVRQIWAKSTSPDHTAILNAVGATQVVFPERETAFRVAARIASPNLLDFIPLEEDYQVMQIGTPASFEGHALRELALPRRFGIYVVAVKGTVPAKFTFLPGPDFVLKGSDMVVAIGRARDLARLEKEAPDIEFDSPAGAGEPDRTAEG